MNYNYQQLIGGAWQNASNGGTWDVLNPATEEVVRTVPFGNAEDCSLAIEAAAKAFPAWSGKTAYERAALLKKAAELIRERAADLARTTVLEAGKPIAAGQRRMGRRRGSCSNGSPKKPSAPMADGCPPEARPNVNW